MFNNIYYLHFTFTPQKDWERYKEVNRQKEQERDKVCYKESLNYFSTNVIYCITCTKGSHTCKFKPQYIGMTKRRVSNRHKYSINPESTKTATHHSPNNFCKLGAKILGFYFLVKNII